MSPDFNKQVQCEIHESLELDYKAVCKKQKLSNSKWYIINNRVRSDVKIKLSFY